MSWFRSARHSVSPVKRAIFFVLIHPKPWHTFNVFVVRDPTTIRCFISVLFMRLLSFFFLLSSQTPPFVSHFYNLTLTLSLCFSLLLNRHLANFHSQTFFSVTASFPFSFSTLVPEHLLPSPCKLFHPHSFPSLSLVSLLSLTKVSSRVTLFNSTPRKSSTVSLPHTLNLPFRRRSIIMLLSPIATSNPLLSLPGKKSLPGVEPSLLENDKAMQQTDPGE